MDESARILTSVNEDHSIVIQVASEAGHLKLYHSHEELLDELPPGHKEVQSCIFNERREILFIGDDERFLQSSPAGIFLLL